MTWSVCVMAKNRLYSPEYLKELVADPSSSVHLRKSVKEVLLQPFHLRDIAGAVAEILNSSLLRYDAALDGLLLGYRHAKRLGDTAPCHLESSQVSVKIQADFYIFQPRIGNKYNAVVHKLGVAHVGCLLYSHFNISLPIPPEKLGLLRTLSLQTKVTFLMEEFDLTGELPFFKGQLATVNSKSAERLMEGKKSRKRKDVYLNPSKLSIPSLIKPSEEDAGTSKKKGKDKYSKLALNRGSGSETALHGGEVQTGQEVTSPLVTAGKKRRSLSLKQSKTAEADTKNRCSEDEASDDIITPFQRPTEKRKMSLPNVEESQEFDKLKSILKSLRDSPLRELGSGDESLSESIFDFLKSCKDSPAKESRPSKTSQLEKGGTLGSQSVKIKDSQNSASSSSLKEKAKRTEIPVKSPEGKYSGSATPKPFIPNTSFLRANDSSSEDEAAAVKKAPFGVKLSSDDSEDDCRKSVLVRTSPLKGTAFSPRNTPIATSTQKSPPKTRLSPLRFSQKKPEGSSSEESDAKEGVKPDRRVSSPEIRNIPTQNQSEGSSSDESDKRSPAKPLHQNSRISSSMDSDSNSERETHANPMPNLHVLTSMGHASGQRGITNPRKESSSDDNDAPQEKQSQKSSCDNSDSEAAGPEPSHLLSEDSKPASASNMAPRVVKESSSDSDSDGSTSVLPVVGQILFSPKMSSKNIEAKKTAAQFSPKKPVLNQPCLDGSVHSRSPLACSTPTVEGTKLVHTNLLFQSLHKPFSAAILKRSEKTDESKKKNRAKSGETTEESKSRSSPKQTDSGFEYLKVKSKKEREKQSKSSKHTRKQEAIDACNDLEEKRRLLLERFFFDSTTRADLTTNKTKKEKKRKKPKREVSEDRTTAKTSTLTIQEAVIEPPKQDENAKTKARSRKKASKDTVRDMEDVIKQKELTLIEKNKLNDSIGPEEETGNRKSKKRKFDEHEVKPSGEGRKICTMQSDPNVGDHKKRTLFSAKVDDSYSGVNISLGTGNTTLTGLDTKCKKSRKVKKVDLKVKLDTYSESSPLKEADTNEGNKKKRKSILFGGSGSVGITQSQHQFKNNKSLIELVPNPDSVKNTLTAKRSDKTKKTKKKTITTDIVEISNPAHVVTSAPSVPSVKKAKNSTRKSTDGKEGEKASQSGALLQEALVENHSENHPPSKSYAEDRWNSRKKLKRKEEEPSSIGSGSASNLLSSLPVDLEQPAKKKKISKARDCIETENTSKKTKKKKKKEKTDQRTKTTVNEVEADSDNSDFADLVKRMIEKAARELGLDETNDYAQKPAEERKKKKSKK